MIGHSGRNRETSRAVRPEWVTETMAAALKSMAVMQEAWLIALEMLGTISLRAVVKRFQ